MDQIKKAYWFLVAITVGLFLWVCAVSVFVYVTTNHRVADIQASRLESCQSTYKAFREVFRPFFVPESEQTPKQKADQAKFNLIITRKIKSCKIQVKP